MKSIDVTVDGPRGPVDGAFEIDEHHPEGPEVKQWAPGYGEFYTRDGRDFELTALAVPLDALPGPPATELTRISAGAAEISVGFENDGATRSIRSLCGANGNFVSPDASS